MSILIILHLLAAVVWVGGMFFAYIVLRRSAVEALEPSARLTLWRQTFRFFFPWVWMAAILLPVTGYWMVFGWLGGMANVGWHVHVMQALGIVMILLFLHLYFAPFKRLRRSVDGGDFTAAGKTLDQIRMLVSINLILGLIVVAVASGGRYL